MFQRRTTWDDVVKAAYAGYQMALNNGESELARTYEKFLETAIHLRDGNTPLDTMCTRCHVQRKWKDESMCYACISERETEK